MKVRFIAGMLLLVASLSSQAGVITTVTVDSATDLTITMSGTIDGPTPDIWNTSWMFILLNPSATVNNVNDNPANGAGDIFVGSTDLDRAFVRSSLGGPHIQLNFSPGIVPGAVVSGSQTLTFDTAHGITLADLDGAQLFHGGGYPNYIPDGVFQGLVNTAPVPAPAGVLLLGLGLIGLLKRSAR